MKKILFAAAAMLLTLTVFAQERTGLTTYTLDNGLTVYLWEDHDQPDVTGYVAVRAGAIDEPKEYTGLAHYLEHMLFKGTDKIGALDWEKEKPLYDSIIALYDQFSDATDPAIREQLTQKINEKSLEAAKYATTEEFFNLMDGIGAEGVNAFTSYDMTCYHNSFPGFQMQKWLTIFSDRLMNPVFRTFQAELENVFEEYNMYEDNISTQMRNQLYSKLYEGHPYERNVIGLPEHLKNPRLSKLIEFYNTWYVPNNMALIMVGDFDTETAKPLIEQTFGRLVAKPLPERIVYPETNFAGNPKYTFKIGYNPSVYWGYKGVAYNNQDALALQFCCGLLSNSMSTGLLDKITMDGTVSYAGASFMPGRDRGRVMIMAMPYYDVNQQTYESNGATERIVFKEVEKLKNGNIEDWLFKSVKEEMFQNIDLAFESSSAKMDALVQTFIYDTPLDDIFTEREKIEKLTIEDVKTIAKKYFDADHVVVQFEEGTPKKNKLAKPKIKPLDQPKGAESEYAKAFKALPEGQIKEVYNDFNDVTTILMDENDKDVKLHYTVNPKNNIFSMTLRYGIGTEEMPMLEYAVELMNAAGVQPSTDAQAFRRQLSELGGRCVYSVNSSYMTVQIVGNEDNLEKICKLIQSQMLFPKLDEKQFDRIKGNELSSRFIMKKQEGAQASALLSYALYGKKSKYLDVVPFMDIYHMQMYELTTKFVDATKYALDIHYVGKKSIDDVKTVLMGSLPLVQDAKASNSPFIQERVSYTKPTIFFLPNNNVQQAKLYFYVNGVPYNIDNDIDNDAFNQYFGGGFSGLVLDEIRVKRSMAYTAVGYFDVPDLQGKDTYFLGYVGTQSDKVADAVSVYLDLMNDMPENDERIGNIRTALKQSYLTSKPNFRSKSQVYDYWRQIGYNDDPARVNMSKIENLTFDEIVSFYKENLQGKPVTIVIMGDPKLIDLKAIQAKVGCKVTKMSSAKIFAPIELDF